MGNFAGDLIANLMGGGSQPAAAPKVDVNGLIKQATDTKKLVDQLGQTAGAAGSAYYLGQKKLLDGLNNQIRAAGGKAVE